MNTKTVRIVSVILLIAFGVSIFMSGIYQVFAEPTNQEIIQEENRRQEEIQQNIDSTTEEKYAALSVLTELTEQVDSLQAEIDVLDSTLANYYTEIELLNGEIEKASERIMVQDELLRKRIRAMDENGNIGILDILLNAKSFTDLLDKIDAVKTITEYDQTILKRYEDAKADVERKKAEVEDKMILVEDTKNQIVTKQDEVEAVQAKKQQEVDALSSLIAQYEEELAASKRAEAEANERIRQAAAKMAPIVASYNFTSGALNYPFGARYIVTSPFGGRISPISGVWEGHSGIDFGAPYGTPILASSDGVVITAGFNTGGYGNYVVIDHGGGIYTLYAHASTLNVSSGDFVSAGQQIAGVGSTGWSTGPHLHFEVRVNGSCVDPAGYIPVY